MHKQALAGPSSAASPEMQGAPWPLPPAGSFNPLFRHPIGPEDEDSKIVEEQPAPAHDLPAQMTEAVPVVPVPIPKASSSVTSTPIAPSTSPSPSIRAKQPHAPTRSSPLNPHTSSSPSPPAGPMSAHLEPTPSTGPPASSSAYAAPAPAKPAASSTSTVAADGMATDPALDESLNTLASAAASGSRPATAEALAALLHKFVESDKLNMAGAKEDAEPLVNEDGLPIHEIRETPEGKALDDGVIASTSNAEAMKIGQEEKAADQEEEQDGAYWSEEAKARRKALFDRVFGGGLDSDEDEEDHDGDDEPEHGKGKNGDDSDEDVDAEEKTQGKKRAGRKSRHDDSGESEDDDERGSLPLSIGSRRTSSPPPHTSDISADPTVNISAPTPVSPASPSFAIASSLTTPPNSNASTHVGLGAPPNATSESRSPHPSSARRTSASIPPPAKGILKSAPRKKSVSFDESVPIPPDSPERPLGAGKGKMGWQLPLPIAVGGGEESFGEKAIPVINPPTPKNKDKVVIGANGAVGASGKDGFAGFKRGFLNSGSNTQKGGVKEKEVVQEPPIAGSGRKPSLFAQRLAEKAVVESAAPSAAMPPTPPGARSSAKPKPALPKMSESTGTSSVKPAVIEKPPATREQVKEASKPEIANWTPLSQLPPNAPSGYKPGEYSAAAPAENTGEEDAEGEDEDDDDFHDDEMEFDSDEEDEYDLDDALLARELALQYHRQKMYQPRTYGSDEEADAEGAGDDADPDTLDLGGTDAGGLGNVMLALPQVEGGDGPQIVNPTPDDWRRFVRVGRLENGNLVLAPGQEGWEGEEDGETHGEEGGDETYVAASSNSQQSPVALTASRPAAAATKATSAEIPELTSEEKKANVEHIKRVLLGLEEDRPRPQPILPESINHVRLPPTLQRANQAAAPTSVESPTQPAEAVSAKPVKAETKGLGDIVERSAPVAGSSKDGIAGQGEAPPKKVSRFKAARMGV